ncbi:hypothetical protein GCM10009855_01750 [Gordonia cholesterolivorans]|uniref:Uncharacterized protein n=1 Tax=Gordonia cholesterolivorans TaxID=559625 RepID=A0ABN3H1U1_9ACTN
MDHPQYRQLVQAGTGSGLHEDRVCAGHDVARHQATLVEGLAKGTRGVCGFGFGGPAGAEVQEDGVASRSELSHSNTVPTCE